MSCAERWRVGDDMQAWPKEGVRRLVWPATRLLSLSLSRSRGAREEGGAGGGREGGRGDLSPRLAKRDLR